MGIYVSFNEQEILLTEPGYGNYCVDFDALKKYQKQTGYILKSSAYKVYKLFRFFIMKDPILHAISREQTIVTQVDVSANSAETPLVEMEIAREHTLPKLRFSDTEKLMDDLSLTQIVQASRFNTYSSDGYDSMEAERDICMYSEEYFKHTSTSFLQGLRYTPTENISDWIKRKQSYKPAIAIPKTFEELLEEKIIFDFNFLFALDPVNINKEVNMLHRSAHIFCETIRDKIRNAMKKLFYNDEAMRAHMFKKKISRPNQR